MIELRTNVMKNWK